MPQQTDTAPHTDATIIFCTFEELPQVIHSAGLPVSDIFLDRRTFAARYEPHDSFDFFAAGGRHHAIPGDKKQFAVFFDATRVVVAHNSHPDVNRLQKDLDAGIVKREPAGVFVALFDIMLSDEGDKLDKIEVELVNLETRIMVDNPDDCTAEIMGVRKRLLGLGRYYDTLYGILQGLSENVNGFLPKQSSRYFRLQAGRVDRLSASVHNLQDSAAQVREAYQNQLDINLNQIMRLFTVITAIFMPLTLLVGWYGMNFIMPEYSAPWAYPIVIGVSVIITVLLLIWFKKKRWY